MPITQTLAKWFSNYDSQKSPGSKLRVKRVLPLLQMIESIYKNNGSLSIIDLGGTTASTRTGNSAALRCQPVMRNVKA